MKACIFDIETSDLAAVGAGILLCAVIKPFDSNKHVILRADHIHVRLGKETRLVKAVIDELGKYDLWIGHNIRRFDYLWLKSRAFVLNTPLPKNAIAYDTLTGFRNTGFKTRDNGFGKPSASLGFVVDFMRYEQQKTSLFPSHHWDIIWGDKEEREKAMGDLVAHCYADVLMNEKCYLPILNNDPNPNLKRLR